MQSGKGNYTNEHIVKFPHFDSGLKCQLIVTLTRLKTQFVRTVCSFPSTTRKRLQSMPTTLVAKTPLLSGCWTSAQASKYLMILDAVVGTVFILLVVMWLIEKKLRANLNRSLKELEDLNKRDAEKTNRLLLYLAFMRSKGWFRHMYYLALTYIDVLLFKTNLLFLLKSYVNYQVFSRHLKTSSTWHNIKTLFMVTVSINAKRMSMKYLDCLMNRRVDRRLHRQHQ